MTSELIERLRLKLGLRRTRLLPRARPSWPRGREQGFARFPVRPPSQRWGRASSNWSERAQTRVSDWPHLGHARPNKKSATTIGEKMDSSLARRPVASKPGVKSGAGASGGEQLRRKMDFKLVCVVTLGRATKLASLVLAEKRRSLLVFSPSLRFLLGSLRLDWRKMTQWRSEEQPSVPGGRAGELQSA